MTPRPYRLIFFLTAFFLNAQLASADASDFRFEVSDAETITITGYRGPGGDVSIPAEIGGKPVTAVARGAFRRNREITAIRFPETLTSLGREAFRENTQLTDVHIPASLTDITRPAFNRCPRLMNFHIHEDNPAYRSVDGVFFTKDMKEIRHYPQGREGDYVIPEGVTRIRDEAFRWAKGLTGITIPDSVTWIGKQAFRGCEGLTEITLPKNLETLVRQGRHFNDCVNLKKIVIPDGVTDIPQHAFRGCTSLEEVILPANLESIQLAAFMDCSSLTQITIPANVRQIRGGNVFAGCEKLEAIFFEGDAPEVSGRDHFPEGVTIFRKASAAGWPEPGEDWQGRPTAISSP